jgi:protein O-GlcNAc transferase
MTTGRNDPCPCGSGKKYKHCCETKQSGAKLPAAELNQLGMLVNTGQFAVVETRAPALLQQYPDEAGLWKLLAIALQMQGKSGLAAFEQAAVLLPSDAGAHMNLGNALQGVGRLEEAVQSYQRALAIKPTFAEAHNNLGASYTALGQLEAAAASYRRAVQFKPDFASAHSGLGGVLRQLEQWNEAAACYRRAIRLQPDFAEAHNNLGVTLRDLGQFDQAVTSYRQALKIQPDNAEVLSNLGVALRDLGQLDEAVRSFRQALATQPDDAETLSNLGLAWHDLGRLEEAVQCYKSALAINPDYAEAYNNLGLTQNLLGLYNDSQESFRHALKIEPNDFISHTGLLFSLNYTALSPEDYLNEARRFGEQVAQKVTARYTAWQCTTHPQTLRVGVVSADLNGHPVGYFLESLLAQLDPARIELIAYTNNPISDDLTARIKPYFSAWKPIFAFSNQAAAQLIHDDGVHVLLDLSGHTAKNRLPMFAWKPAPVQVSWLGYFASTGVAELDYVLADETGVPRQHQSHFSETVWYLPDTRLCFTPPDTDLAVAPLPSLSNGFVTFGCYQNLAKVTNEVLAVWGRIFAALPQARLRLVSKYLKDPSVAAQLQLRLQQCGIEASRVLLHAAVPRQEYLASHAEVDMLLDTFPYPGGTTTCESLWMGVPTLTLAGDTLLSRQGASLMTAARLPDWIATSEDDYVAKAIEFSQDVPRLAALRAGLREQVRVSPLFDAPRFAKHFEQALWGMWQATV